MSSMTSAFISFTAYSAIFALAAELTILFFFSNNHCGTNKNARGANMASLLNRHSSGYPRAEPTILHRTPSS